ncbi:MAG: LA_2272 family surface repeat-containing protein [Myxococcales bacterium]
MSAPASLFVEVVPGRSNLDPEAVRVAIGQELGILTTQVRTPQTLGRVHVEGIAGSNVVVSYESTDGNTKLERRVALPVDASRRALVISWVTGNLVRNEANEILSGMKEPATAGESAIADENATSAPTDVAAPTQTKKEKTGTTAASAAAESRAPVAARPVVVSRRGFRVAASQPVEPAEPDLGAIRVGQVSLFSSTLAFPQDGPSHRYALSLGGLYNHIGGLSGFGVGLGVDRIEYGARGVQISTLWADGNDHAGFLVASIGTRGRGDLTGTEMAGLVTWRSGCVVGAQLSMGWASAERPCRQSGSAPQRASTMTVTGAQISGLVSSTRGGFNGAQLSVGAAIATGSSTGWQSSGAISYAGLGLDGVQTSVGVNVVRGEMHGLQLSGAMNYASPLNGAQLSSGLNLAQDVTGLQLGLVNAARDDRGLQLGLVNIARDAHGLQLGLVNIASKNDGLALGLFNWAEGARVQPTYFFQTPGYHNLGYRNLSGHAIGSISFGYDPSKEYARTHFSVGARTTLDRFGFGIETGYGWVLEKMNSGPTDRAHEIDLVGTVTVEIVRNLVSFYGGAGAALPVAGVVAVEPHGLAQAGISLL